MWIPRGKAPRNSVELKGKEKPECYKTWYWNVKQNKWLTPNEYHKIKRVSNNQILFNKNTDEFFENDDSFEGHVYNHKRLEKSTRYSLMPISSILSENEMYQLAFLRAFQLDDFKIEDNYYLDLTFKAALDHVYYFFTESTIAKTEGGAKDIDPNAESGLENVTLALFASSTDSINEAVRLIKHSNSIFFKFDWGTTLGYIISPFAPKMNSVLIKVSNKVEQSIFKAGGYLRVKAVDWAKKFKLKGNIGAGMIVKSDELTNIFINGWTKEKILALPKGSRPNPSTYLNKNYIDNHLAMFENEGGSFLVIRSWIKNSTYESFPLNKYVMSRKDMQSAISKYRETKNINTLEDALGYNKGDLHGLQNEIFIFHVDKTKYKFAMPTGNEIGANKLWLPGGKTSGNCIEATIINKQDPLIPIKHDKSIGKLKELFNWEKL